MKRLPEKEPFLFVPDIEEVNKHYLTQIEADFSLIKAKMLRSIHTVTEQGFLLKAALFVISFTFDKLA